MGPAASKNGDGAPDDGATRDRIVAAATQCFLQLGIAKTTMRDVAQAARISRGTVYRHFPDRRALIDAAVTQQAQRYYDEAATAMARQPTLVGQIGAFAEVFARTCTQHASNVVVPDDLHLFRIIASDTDGALRRMSSFLLPYVSEAKGRGEVPAEVEDHEASELLARNLLSITAMPLSVAFDVNRPATVRRYFERHAVTGLTA